MAKTSVKRASAYHSPGPMAHANSAKKGSGKGVSPYQKMMRSGKGD